MSNIATFTSTITNNGERSGTKDVVLKIPHLNVEKERNNIQLDPGESTTVSFDIDTSSFSYGTYDVKIQTNDGEDYSTLTLLQKDSFQVSNLNVTSEVFVSGEVDLSFVVKNIGDVEGTKTIEINVPNVYSEQFQETLNGKEQQSYNRTISISNLGPGQYPVYVSTPDDSANNSFEVQKNIAVIAIVDESHDAYTGGHSFWGGFSSPEHYDTDLNRFRNYYDSTYHGVGVFQPGDSKSDLLPPDENMPNEVIYGNYSRNSSSQDIVNFAENVLPSKNVSGKIGIYVDNSGSTEWHDWAGRVQSAKNTLENKGHEVYTYSRENQPGGWERWLYWFYEFLNSKG